MKALLSLVLFFASAGAFAQGSGAWTTFYNPRANGLPIRYESEGLFRTKSSSLDGVCMTQGKLFGFAGDENSVGKVEVKAEFVSDVDSHGVVTPGPVAKRNKKGELKTVTVITQISCFNYKQEKQHKRRK